MDFDFAVHAEGGFIVRSGEPWRVTFRANCFDHVFQIFADTNFLVRLGFRCHFEDVRKDIVLRIVVDDFNTAFFILAQRAKYSAILTHNYLLESLCCKDSHDLIPSSTQAFKNRTWRNRNITRTQMGDMGAAPRDLRGCPHVPHFCLFVASYPDRCWRYAAGETPTC